jgi:hypothetical protein
VSILNIGAFINVIEEIIRKSFPITLLLFIAAIAFILPFRNRSRYYEMSGIGADDLTQMSYFNTTFEYNIFQILQFGLGGISVSQMGIDIIQGSNWVNYFIYGCFIFIMPIMFFNILTSVSLDAIGDMIKNASDNIVWNKIHYFEIIDFLIEEQKAIEEEEENNGFKKKKGFVKKIIKKFIKKFIKKEKKTSRKMYEVYEIVA